MLSLSRFVVSSSLSSGIIRGTALYRMVNAGLCDYKKKNHSNNGFLGCFLDTSKDITLSHYTNY